MTLYEQYLSMKPEGALIALEPRKTAEPYFCYPTNARPIGFEGCVMYCFLEEQGEAVFAANPESCCDRFVYPLAESFRDFLELIVACGSANPVEQSVWMSRRQFEQHLLQEQAEAPKERAALLQRLREELGIEPKADPYGYVQGLQQNFDPGCVTFADEYYETLGLEQPQNR